MNYSIKDVEIVSLLLVIIGIIVCFSMVINNNECRISVEQMQEMCDEIDELCQNELKDKCLQLHDQFVEENNEYINWSIYVNDSKSLNYTTWSIICDNGKYHDVPCDCAINTSTPCLMRCIECE
jgi:hypothetical protein